MVMDEKGDTEHDGEHHSDEPNTTVTSEVNAVKGKHRSLKADGTCITCLNKGNNECMKCFSCDVRFHVVRCGDNENMCTPTFLSSFSAFSQTYPCICFICPCCREAKNLSDDNIMSERFTVMEEKISSLTDEIINFKTFVTNKVISKPTVTDTNTTGIKEPSLWSQVAAKVPTKVVVKSKTGTDTVCENSLKKIERHAIEKGIPVSRVYNNNKNDTVFVLPDQESRKLFTPIVSEVCSSDNHVISTPASKQPVITILVNRNYEKEELPDLISILAQQNKTLGLPITSENCTPLFVKTSKDKFIAVLRVSNELRRVIQNYGDRLFTGLNSSQVRDRLFVKRCNMCQYTGHWHKDDVCKGIAACGICAGPHETHSCSIDPKGPTEKLKCIVCIRAGKNPEQSHHVASSFNCPCYKTEQEKLKKLIPFHQQNNRS